MSAWGDMMRRGAGEETRIEDRIDVQEINDRLSQPITFVGIIDNSGLPNVPASGQVYMTNDKVTINGVEYPSGCMLVYDGNTWHNIGDYRYQVVDAANNIGYYQPKLSQEESKLWEL